MGELDPNEIKTITRLMRDKRFVKKALRCEGTSIYTLISDESRQEKDPAITSFISDFSEFDHERTASFSCNYLLVSLINDREIGSMMYIYRV